ncbi:MAG: ABC transporter ATP-binding protein [Acidimicrobiales bacterium]|nr:ABC transporter ATP-binding protein [Acidimicrobiales bacterium]RZV48181.1 MAG: ABC transporter ATP-binding protein [Acidimicrobiales bacterium]
MTDLALQTHELRKHFGSTQVLRSVDLAIPRHSIYGFLGPNGAGKSTTMKTVMGLLRPSGGSIEVFGRDTRRYGPSARAHIGYLPQHPRFHPYRTCRQTLLFVAALYPGHRDRRELRDHADELLDAVGLSDLANRRTHGLSGGESQRLGLAQALIAEPELLILDEPAAALDPEGRHDVLEIIEGLRGRTTVFYSTHILEDVQRVSDRVAMISNGRIVADGPLTDLLSGDDSSWTIRTLGSSEAVQARLSSEPWVSSVDVSRRRDSDVWTVRLAAGAPEEQLLPTILADNQLAIAEFHPSDHTLEDAYLAIVGHNNEH